jgi:hypothetical protein
MRADFELHLAAGLWDTGDIVSSRELPEGFADHVALTRDDSLVLIPMHPRRARAASPQRWTDHMSTPTVLARLALGFALRTGVARAFFHNRVGIRTTDGDGPTLHEHLAAVFDVPRVAVAGAWGPPRPNQKPVLQVFDESGETLGFAKIGWNALTRELVDTEAAFLGTEPRLRYMRVPRLVHHGTWRDNSISISAPELGPIGWHRASRPGPEILAELAGLSPRYRARLDTSPYRAVLETRTAGWRSDEVATALTAVDHRWGESEVEFGHWHGDWAPWNMNSKGPRCIVWDWERTGPGTPVGFDAIHYGFHTAVAKGVSPVVALSDAAAYAARDLAALGILSPDTGALAVLYAIEMRTRFRADDVAWLNGLLPAAVDLFARK